MTKHRKKKVSRNDTQRAKNVAEMYAKGHKIVDIMKQLDVSEFYVNKHKGGRRNNMWTQEDIDRLWQYVDRRGGEWLVEMFPNHTYMQVCLKKSQLRRKIREMA